MVNGWTVKVRLGSARRWLQQSAEFEGFSAMELMMNSTTFETAW